MHFKPNECELSHKNISPRDIAAEKTSMSKIQTTSEEPIVRFLIGGVQKAGTTALHKMLTSHPDIFLPKQKELHFFDTQAVFENRQPSYSSYHEYFNDHTAAQLCGEATPSYVYLDSSIARVRDYNPSMKWIVLLRHPVARAYSHWNMQRSRGIEPLNFLDALQAEPNRINSLPPEQSRRFTYAARSRYSIQIKQLLQTFERKQCLFLTSDQLNQHPISTLLVITRFLGVSRCPIEPVTSHVGTYENTLPNDQLKKLTAQFADDIELTGQLTQLNLNCWN